MWKLIRIFILLVVLGTVLQQSFSDKADLDWKDNFYVALYPVNADGSSEVAAYIKTLTKDDFLAIEDYFAEEGKRYNLGMRQPIALQLGEVVSKIPPAPPQAGKSGLDVLLWSLKFRWFAWNNSPKVAVKPDIRLYLLYYNPVSSPKLTHSTALDKGRIGRVNLFGDKTYAKQNLVITSHELLHTLTATDKYDLATNLPVYPDGYAEPNKQPRYPQSLAELMGGYVPIDETKNEIPKSLEQTLIGEKTAQEIGWLK
jgi:hypothetical protein